MRVKTVPNLQIGVRMMHVHHLKAWPEFYQALRSGRKTFEFRFDDRDYLAGDVLLIREFIPETGNYTDSDLMAFDVLYVLEGDPLPQGYVIMSVKRIR
ncbi:MAG TPA: DUF3850 domain-containing protein [Anaerovoracaceae bacterium]|nr:DUF3850 domain-containing protein [Anaerovoracaceae bacterium]